MKTGWVYSGAVMPLWPLWPVFAVLLATHVAIADDARVLPAGVSRGYVDFYHYHPTTHRYSPDAEREPLSAPFDDATLDETVFTVLAPFGPGVSLGDVEVDYEYAIDVVDLGYAYGVNDRLSIGFHLPYIRIRNDIDIEFDNSGANIGFDIGGNPCALPGAGCAALDEDGVQNLIETTYGIERVDDWQREGIGDLELGAKYLLHRQRDHALAITGGLRIPSGYEDDADLLNDVAWSYGNYAVLLRLHYDFLLSNTWQDLPSSLDAALPLPGDLVFNLTLRYDYMLPDDRIMRIGDTPDQLFTNNRERVDRELGDLYNFELSLRYQASPALSLFTTLTRAWKDKDRISGDLGYNYATLEAYTDSKQQIIVVGLDYSTLAAWRDQQSGLPLEFSLAYRERFEGEGPRAGQANPVLYTRGLVAGLTLYF